MNGYCIGAMFFFLFFICLTLVDGVEELKRIRLDRQEPDRASMRKENQPNKSFDAIRFSPVKGKGYRADMLADDEPVCPSCLVEHEAVVYLADCVGGLHCPLCDRDFNKAKEGA